MPNLRTKKLGGVFRGLFVGSAGVGKTIAAGSFPGPMKIYDFDNRVAPLVSFYPFREDIEYTTVVSEKAGRNDSIDFMDFCQEFVALQDRCDYETIVIDSITSMGICCVLYTMAVNGQMFGRNKLLVPGMNEYKVETATTTKILEIIKSLPCHVICTAHPVEKLRMQEAGKMETMESTFSMSGWGSKTPSLIPLSFDEMYYFYNDVGGQLGQQPKRFVSTVATEFWDCKTALPLPPIFEVTGAPLYKLLEKFLKDYNIKLETARKNKKSEKGDEPTIQ